MVHYWLGQVDENAALRRKLQPLVETYATADQRASFYQNMARLEFQRNRDVATDEIVAWARLALSALQEMETNAAVPAAHFFLGFCLLWRGDTQGALEPLQTALRLAEQTGDVSLQARCLAYLTIAHRQRGRLAETEQYAAHAMAVATAAHMPEYIGMAWANQTWLAWRKGDFQAAEERGRAALTAWQQLPASHASRPFQWTVRLAAAGGGAGQRGGCAAIDLVRALLDPARQRVPDSLEALLAQAIQRWEESDVLATARLLEQALVLAQEMGYL